MNKKSNPDNESELKLSTPLGTLEAGSDDENLNLKFSAYGVIDFQAALTQPKFDPPDSLKVKAIKAAKNNKPGKNATTLSSDEMEIVLTTRETIRSSLERISGIISKYRSDMSQLEVRLATPFDPTHAHLGISSYAAKVRSHYKPAIEAQYRKYASKLMDFRYFKSLNNLERPAKYPTVHNKTIFLFLFIIFIETILNGALFKDVMVSGLVGGWVMAFFISAFNVIVGVFMGYYLLRHLNGRSSALRVITSVASFLFSLLMLIFFIYIAQYRDKLGDGIDLDNLGMPVLPSLSIGEALGNMTSFNHWESYVFLIASLVIYVFSVIKGLQLDDVFPGYGDVDRAWKKEEEKYLKLQEEVFHDTKKFKGYNRGQIYKIQNTYRQWLYAYHEIPEIVEGHIKTFKDYLKSLDMQCEALLKRYRENNMAVRTDVAPEYFGTYDSVLPEIEIDGLEMNTEIYEDARKRLKDIEVKSKEIIESFDNHIAELDVEFKKYISDLEAGVDEQDANEKKKIQRKLKEDKSIYNELKNEQV